MICPSCGTHRYIFITSWIRIGTRLVTWTQCSECERKERRS